MKKVIGIPAAIGITALLGLYLVTRDFLLVWQAFTLAVIEVSMSFDNATANTMKLKKMSRFWQQMFFYVGMPIAVFGMRFFLPLAIVGQVEGLSLPAAYHLAVTAPQVFATSLASVHEEIAYFGAAFLMLTAFEFFGGDEYEEQFMAGESLLVKFAKIPFGSTILVMVLVMLAQWITGNRDIGMAGLAGAITFNVVSIIKHYLEVLDEKLGTSTSKIAKLVAGGLGGFIYLEVLDASFSLDGVVAAFAIAKDIWVVTIGLGIGASVIRQLTLYMVDTGASDTLKFLPNGAFLSILTLSIFMFLVPFVEVPSFIAALTSVAFIGVAIVASLGSNTDKEVAHG